MHIRVLEEAKSMVWWSRHSEKRISHPHADQLELLGLLGIRLLWHLAPVMRTRPLRSAISDHWHCNCRPVCRWGTPGNTFVSVCLLNQHVLVVSFHRRKYEEELKLQGLRSAFERSHREALSDPDRREHHNRLWRRQQANVEQVFEIGLRRFSARHAAAQKQQLDDFLQSDVPRMLNEIRSHLARNQ